MVMPVSLFSVSIHKATDRQAWRAEWPRLPLFSSSSFFFSAGFLSVLASSDSSHFWRGRGQRTLRRHWRPAPEHTGGPAHPGKVGNHTAGEAVWTAREAEWTAMWWVESATARKALWAAVAPDSRPHAVLAVIVVVAAVGPQATWVEVSLRSLL